jgi:TPR repeat protein
MEANETIPGVRTLGSAYSLVEWFPQSEKDLADVQLRAEAGNPDAEYILAQMYLRMDSPSQGPPDFSRSLPYLHRAANAGHARAQYQLALLYGAGVFGGRSDAESTKWFLASARNGYEWAQFEVGRAFILGRGVASNLVEARYWLITSSNQGNALACYWLAQNCVSSDSERKTWLVRSARGWCTRAMHALADDLLDEDTHNSTAKAFVWLSLAARKGDKDAISALPRVSKTLSPRDLARCRAEETTWLSQYPLRP